MSDNPNTDLLDLTSLIVANHVSNNNVPIGDVAGLIKSVHDTLKGLAALIHGGWLEGLAGVA